MNEHYKFLISKMKGIINIYSFVFINYFFLFYIFIFQSVDAKEIKKNTYNQKINVIFDNNNKKINIGTSVTVNWDINDRIIKANEDNLEFVVFSMPYTVRLKGDYFLPIPPKQNLPFGIKYDTYMFRVVFPLYLIKQTRGSFIFTPWKAGDFHISWAYFSIKKNTTEITKDSNIVEQLSQNQLYEIIDTKPKIIVQEHIPSMKPKKTIVSLSEKYTIKIYDTWFEVLDTKSENLIFKKSGRNPNFSDSSRFLCYIYGDKLAPTIKLIDMISQTLILSDSGFTSSSECLGWGKNDWILFFYNRSKYSIHCNFKFPTLDTQRAGSRVLFDRNDNPLVSCNNTEYETEYYENETQNCRFYYPFPLCRSLNNISLLLPEEKRKLIGNNEKSIISYMKKHDINDDFCSMYWEDYEENVDWYNRRGYDWQIEGGFYFSHLLPTEISTEYEFEVQEFLNDHTVDKFYNKQLKKKNDTSYSVAKKNNFINNQIIRSKSIPIYYPLSSYSNKAILERLRDMNYIFYKNETSQKKNCSECCNLTEMLTKCDNCTKYDKENDIDFACSFLYWETSGNIYALENNSGRFMAGGMGSAPGQVSLSMIIKTYDSVKEFYFHASSSEYISDYIHYTDNTENIYTTDSRGNSCEPRSLELPWTFITSYNYTNEIKAYFSTNQILMCSISDLDVMFIFDPSEQNFSEKVEFIKENDSYYIYLKNKELSKTEKIEIECDLWGYEHLESSLKKKNLLSY